MGATLSTVDAALKETWTDDNVVEQLYNENPFLSRVRKIKNTQVGQQALTPVHTARNGGFTALPAGGGPLNSAGNQGIKQAAWNYKHFHQQISIQGEAIAGTANDTLSVAQVVDLEVRGALSDLNRQLTRQLFLNGDGIICATAAASSTVTIGLNSTSGPNALRTGWIGVGSVIDIGTAADADTAVAATTVSAVSESGNTITVGSAITTHTTDYVSIAGSRSPSDGSSREMNGLQNIVSTADLGGITVSSTPTWQAANVDSTSQALTLALMTQNNRKVHQKTGSPSNYVLTSLDQQEAFYKLVQAQVRFAGDQGLGAGNVDGVQFNGMTVYAQPDCQKEYMYFLTIEDFLIVTAGDPAWQSVSPDGGTLVWRQGYDEYVGKLTVRMNLGARRRNSHAVLSGLT